MSIISAVLDKVYLYQIFTYRQDAQYKDPRVAEKGETNRSESHGLLSFICLNYLILFLVHKEESVKIRNNVVLGDTEMLTKESPCLNAVLI